MKTNKLQFYINLAKETAKQSTCPRAKVGAILINEDRVTAMGYNGAVRGARHCTEIGCSIVKEDNKPHCKRACHSESNLICNAAYHGTSTKGGIVVCTHQPCHNCLKLLVNAGISELYFLKDYPDELAHALYQEVNEVNWKFQLYKVSYSPHSSLPSYSRVVGI